MKEKTAADIREGKLNERLTELAEQGNWTGVLKALDDYDANNERRHSDHRADMRIMRMAARQRLCMPRTLRGTFLNYRAGIHGQIIAQNPSKSQCFQSFSCIIPYSIQSRPGALLAAQL